MIFVSTGKEKDPRCFTETVLKKRWLFTEIPERTLKSFFFLSVDTAEGF